MSRVKRGILLGIGLPLAVVAVLVLWAASGLKQAAGVQLEGIVLTGMPDGAYTGSYEFKRWSNKVLVTVQDERIVAITVQEDVTAASVTDCAGETFRQVLERQDTRIDGVSGATATSKAYCKAIEDALKQ